MTDSHYWLAQWLDENEIHSEWELDHTLQSESGVKGVVQAVFSASEEIQNNLPQYPDSSELGDSIVAGRKLDFSGTTSCPAFECMQQGVDSTFKRVWHYFDQIVVEGLAPQWLAYKIRTTDADHFPITMATIHQQARLLLYLREIGAERFVVFAPKSHSFCQEHWQQHARDLGLAVAVDESQHDKTVKRIVSTSKFIIKEPYPGRWHVTVTGKYFDQPESTIFLPSEGKMLNDPPSPDDIASSIIATHATAMVSDVSLARRLALPLIEPVTLPWITRPYRNGNKSAEDNSIIRVGLPVFDSLTTKDFLKLREDERPEFEAFRAALREAIQSQIAKDPSRPQAAIARSIENEHLRPGLADIEKRIRRR